MILRYTIVITGISIGMSGDSGILWWNMADVCCQKYDRVSQ